MDKNKLMKLEELLKETEALTYINALKVTLTEIKDQVSEIEQHKEYTSLACDKVKRLVRKADNQYRLISKLAQHSGASLAASVSMEDIEPEASDEARNLMEGIDEDDV